MPKTLIRNVSQAAITLPPPYIGIIPPGVGVVVNEPANEVIYALFAVPEAENLLTITEVSDANPTTVRYSRAVAADTIATVTFGSLTAPLDFNGQKGVNAADPTQAQDLVTLAYFNTHGAGGGSGVTYSDLGELTAPGGPYPAIAAGTPVAIVGGTMIAASATSAATAPCAGLYTGSTTNRIRAGGIISGFVGLPANEPLFLAVGGGLTATPPSVTGQVSQRIGESIGTTQVFVQIEDPVYL